MGNRGLTDVRRSRPREIPGLSLLDISDLSLLDISDLSLLDIPGPGLMDGPRRRHGGDDVLKSVRAVSTWCTLLAPTPPSPAVDPCLHRREALHRRSVPGATLDLGVIAALVPRDVAALTFPPKRPALRVAVIGG